MGQAESQEEQSSRKIPRDTVRLGAPRGELSANRGQIPVKGWSAAALGGTWCGRGQRLLGCSGARVLGCSGARLLGCSAARLLGCCGAPQPLEPGNGWRRPSSVPCGRGRPQERRSSGAGPWIRGHQSGQSRLPSAALRCPQESRPGGHSTARTLLPLICADPRTRACPGGT